MYTSLLCASGLPEIPANLSSSKSISKDACSCSAASDNACKVISRNLGF